MAKIDISQFDAAVSDLLADFAKQEYAARQAALAAGAAVMVDRLAAASPQEEGGFAQSWEAKQYNDAQYVHNTKTVDGGGKKGIPLSNILEYKEGGRPFIRQTAEAAASDVFNAIKNKLGQ